ncbi:MAG: CapA family protein [Deltaproteobacteria bacterium]|nr:CapA family protein [Deltaproteobacteria bacterium]
MLIISGAIVLACAGAPPAAPGKHHAVKNEPPEQKVTETSATQKRTPTTPPPEMTISEARPQVETEPNTVSLVAVGDICLGRNINAEMVDTNDFTFPFVHVADFLKSADITVGNLEAQLFPGCPLLTGGMRLCGDRRAVAGLVKSGFDVVSVANNHADNFGKRALASSVKMLRANGIQVAGYGKPPVIERNGTRFAFVGYDITKRSVPLKRIGRKLKAAKERADVVVLIMHWGKEYETTPSRIQTNLAQFATKQGADLIIGAHPHVIQPLETVNGAPVAYSLGNFVFDSMMWTEETRKSTAAVFKFLGSAVTSSRLIPGRLVSAGIPELLEMPIELTATRKESDQRVCFDPSRIGHSDRTDDHRTARGLPCHRRRSKWPRE